MAKTKVSVCMIVKDEEKFLSQCLKSIHDVPGVYDIIIVDTGSTDKTKEIALSFPKVKYFYKEFNPWSFKNARNFSISKAKGNWLMYMDADEVFQGAFPDDLPEVIYNFKIKNVTDGGDLVNSFCARMIPNIKGVEFINDVHEIFASTKKQLPIMQYQFADLTHYGYTSEVREAKNKLERNLEMLGKSWEEKKTVQNAYYYGQETFITGNFEKCIELAKEGISFMDYKNPLDLTFEPILYHLLISALIEAKRPHSEIEDFELKLAFKRINPEISTVLCKYYLDRNDPLKAGFYCMQAMKCKNSPELPVKYNENTVKYVSYLMMAEYYSKVVNDQLAALYWLELAHSGGCNDPKVLGSIYQLLPKYKDISKLEYYLRVLYDVTKDSNFLKELVNVYLNSNNEELEKNAIKIMNSVGNNEEISFMKKKLIDTGKQKLAEDLTTLQTVKLEVKDSINNSISVIIPTMMLADEKYIKWNIDILEKNDNVKDIIIVDNSEGKFNISGNKIKVVNSNGSNLGFNQSVNLAMKDVTTPYYMVLNDDCVIRSEIIDSIINGFEQTPNCGTIIVSTVKEEFEEYSFKYIDRAFDEFEEYEPRKGNQYGWCISSKTKFFEEIPKELHTFFGDNLIHYYAWKNKEKTFILKSNYVNHEVSKTINQLYGQLTDENSEYRKKLIEEDSFYRKFIGAAPA